MLAYDSSEFVKTNVYKKIKNWEIKNRPLRVLKV